MGDATRPEVLIHFECGCSMRVYLSSFDGALYTGKSRCGAHDVPGGGGFKGLVVKHVDTHLARQTR